MGRRDVPTGDAASRHPRWSLDVFAEGIGGRLVAYGPALALLVMALLAVFHSAKPTFATPTAPAATRSRYIQTYGSTTMYNQGCDAGQRNANGGVILHFGQPWYQGGLYGANIHDGAATFTKTSLIATAVHAFAIGAADCSSGDTLLRVGVGTSNLPQQNPPGPGYVNSAHGQAWADMVDTINVGLGSLGQDVIVYGASDMELGWNTPAATYAWASGYNGATAFRYWNFGDAAGCPHNSHDGSFHDGADCSGGTGGWTQWDVWRISWQLSRAWAFPEVYSDANFDNPVESSSNLVEIPFRPDLVYAA